MNLIWKRIAAGLYEYRGRAGTYEAERLDRNDYDPHRYERTRWLLRVNGKVTDTEETLGQIKQIVEGYERDYPGKPLIEIL